MMGCSGGEGCWNWETPAHQVTITRGFWIGQKPVTMYAYKRFADATGRELSLLGSWDGWRKENENEPSVRMAHEINPITGLTWDEAHAYCDWMGGRLPTEAEWEYAARGGDAKLRYEPIDKLALCDPENEGNLFDPPCSQINGFALIDMVGGVSQWANDFYDPNYYQNSPPRDPQGPMSGAERVLRGGCYLVKGKLVHDWDRMGVDPAHRHGGIGLRCVRDGENP
jgi:formylglycine-generating enzyme required for sulfatase activity